MMKDKLKAFADGYKGLIGFIFIYELIAVAFFSTFSQPMIERFHDIFPWLFPLMNFYGDLEVGSLFRHADYQTYLAHQARAIMLYHSLAIPFLAVVAFFVLDTYVTRPKYEEAAKWTLFTGAMVSSIFGLDFAYFSQSWVSHGLFIVGQALVFYAGILILFAIWPTKNFPATEAEPLQDATFGNTNLEYVNVVLTVIALLISSIIGGIASANFGQISHGGNTGEIPPTNPYYTFIPRLAEQYLYFRFGSAYYYGTGEAVEDQWHNLGFTYKEMVVTHLHIMLALLAAVVLLLAQRHAKVSGIYFKINNILYTPGVIILSIGAWLVITPWEHAHDVINVGASFLLIVGLITAVYGWGTTIKNVLAKEGLKYEEVGWGKRIIALFKDPVNFGLYFQLIWVNVVSTVPGIYVGINLREAKMAPYAFRSVEMTEVEYAFNVGHWHILATLIAIMMVFMLIDWYDTPKGVVRTIAGWLLTLGTIFGFGFAAKYMLRDPNASYDFDFLMIDVGLAFLFIGLALFALYVLIDYVISKWKKTEVGESQKEPASEETAGE